MVVGSGTRGTLKEDVTPTQQQTKTEQKVDYPGAEGRANIIKPGHWSRRRNRCGSRPRRGNAGDTSTDTSAPRRNILAEVIKDTEETNAEGHHGPSQGTHSGCRRRKAAATWTRARGPGRYMGKSEDTETNSGRRNLSETGALVVQSGTCVKVR